jgi:hypothetical protein
MKEKYYQFVGFQTLYPFALQLEIYFSHFVDCEKKFDIYLPFTYLFQFIITSCGLFIAFRYHLLSDLTLTRAIHLISAYALNTVYRQNPTSLCFQTLMCPFALQPETYFPHFVNCEKNLRYIYCLSIYFSL